MGNFKLGKMTLRSLFGKPETILYPEQTRFQPKGLKGQVVNDIDACILCSICAKRCPTDAITVDKKDGSWSIDRFKCVQCGTCVRDCPKTSLRMDSNYPAPAAEKSVDTLKKPSARPSDASDA
ncbi:MAG: 4Fe-4S binding protein [Slackia sp.]|nr:4Fe-4S binding protein [Slackia sp.]